MRSMQRTANLKKLKASSGNQQTRSEPGKVRFEISIEELIFHGLPAEQRYAIADALDIELQRLFSESRDGWTDVTAQPGTPVNVDGLRAAQISASPQTSPASIGTQIAQSVFTCISQNRNG